MALVLPYPTLSGTVTASYINSNFSAIATKFGGNIINADLSSTAAIATSKLAADKYEIVLGLTIGGSATADTDLDAAVGSRFFLGNIPYDTAGATYTITSAETMTYAAGARTAAVYSLFYGTAAQLIAATHEVIDTGITTGTGAATYTGTTLGLDDTSITTTTTPQFFVLQVTTQGASWAVTDSFHISLKLKKALRT